MTIDVDPAETDNPWTVQHKAMSVPMSSWNSASEPMDLRCSVPSQRSIQNLYPDNTIEPLDLSTPRSAIMEYPGIPESYNSSGYDRKSRSHDCDRYGSYYQNEYNTPQRGSCRYAGTQWSDGNDASRYWNDPSRHCHDVHSYDCSYRAAKRSTTTPMFVAYPLTGTEFCYSPHTQYSPRYAGSSEMDINPTWHTEGVPQKWIATEYSFPEMNRTRVHTNGGSCRYSTEVEVDTFHNANRRAPYGTRTDSGNLYVNDSVFQSKLPKRSQERPSASASSPCPIESQVQISHNNHLTGGIVKSNVDGLGVEETVLPECLPPINIPLNVFEDIASKVSKHQDKKDKDLSLKVKDFIKNNKPKDGEITNRFSIFNKEDPKLTGRHKSTGADIKIKQEPDCDELP